MSNTELSEVRAFYAKQMTATSGSNDPRFERIFELVPREAFLPPGPWKIVVGGRYLETPNADPIHLYQNSLVALDEEKGINNGEPFLHARWIGEIAPQKGDEITHIGAGTGYYTAILSMLTLPKGHVTAFEIDETLASQAKENLIPFENVTMIQGDAVSSHLPKSDIIYVNAGVSEPPIHWLEALKPGGRIIFPWRPSSDVGLTLLATKVEGGFNIKPLFPVWFIPCIGASTISKDALLPNPTSARTAQSAYLINLRKPDNSAVAIGEHFWVSSEPVPKTSGIIH